MVLGDPSCLQIDPRWSLDAPWVLLDAPTIKYKMKQIQINSKRAPANPEICKDAHREIIQVGLVEVLYSVSFHGVPFGDKSDASCVLMMHHEYS